MCYNRLKKPPLPLWLILHCSNSKIRLILISNPANIINVKATNWFRWNSEWNEWNEWNVFTFQHHFTFIDIVEKPSIDVQPSSSCDAFWCQLQIKLKTEFIISIIYYLMQYARCGSDPSDRKVFLLPFHWLIFRYKQNRIFRLTRRDV